MSKYLELAKKLKALVEQGVGGEKRNAKIQLDKLLTKHRLTLADLEAEQRRVYGFRISKTNRRLFGQIVGKVVAVSHPVRYDSRKPTALFAELTPAEYIEVTAKFEFYKNALAKQLELAYLAFIVTNDLLLAPGESRSETSIVQKEQLEKARRLAKGMEKAHYRQQLPKPSPN